MLMGLSIGIIIINVMSMSLVAFQCLLFRNLQHFHKCTDASFDARFFLQVLNQRFCSLNVCTIN